MGVWRQPTFVLTHRELPRSRDTVEFYSGDLAQFVNGRLRPMFHSIWFVGGGMVSGECLRLGLADEVRYSILPILIGDGIRFLRSSTKTSPSIWRRSKPTRAGRLSFVTRCDNRQRPRRSLSYLTRRTGRYHELNENSSQQGCCPRLFFILLPIAQGVHAHRAKPTELLHFDMVRSGALHCGHQRLSCHLRLTLLSRRLGRGVTGIRRRERVFISVELLLVSVVDLVFRPSRKHIEQFSLVFHGCDPAHS